MEKRIAGMTRDPHTINLTDRTCSWFIDPKSGSIFVDEGDGQDRMNGVVFSPANAPSFAVRPAAGVDHQLILDYRGTEYLVGVSAQVGDLNWWAESANLLLAEKRQQLETVGHTRLPSLPRIKPDDATRRGVDVS
jgi:hypothetical protein